MAGPRIVIIAAMTKDRVIGKDNRLIWHIPDDLKNFKRLTSGNTVVMGRKTFESIGRPLPNRNNIVVSSSMPPLEGVIVCRSVEEALQKAQALGKEVFVIGGGEVYRQTIDYADTMVISYVKKDYQGDAYFPQFVQRDWVVESRQDRPDFEIVVYQRKR